MGKLPLASHGASARTPGKVSLPEQAVLPSVQSG